MSKTVITTTEWPALVREAAMEARAAFPDLVVRADAGGIDVESADGATAGRVELVHDSMWLGSFQFRLVRSPPHARTPDDARALFAALARVADCGKWLERRLDAVVMMRA
jgi:hypothetical protein